ncbi:MAG TPA: hypothetical protein VGB55_03470 [Tepidisphaeraceae bacterium]
MKRILLLIAIGLTGCDTTPKTGNPAVEASVRPPLLPVTASALVFDPPVAYAQPMPDLSRGGRSPGAFVGYEQAISESFHLYQRDQQSGDGWGRSFNDFDRTAYFGRSSMIAR